MAKLYATINTGKAPLTLERATPNAPWTIKGRQPDLVKTAPGQYSVVIGGQSHSVLVLKEDKESGTVRLRIGAKTYTVRLEDEQLGADYHGMRPTLLVKEGDAVKKNDPVLILEAMKMENVIKSPGDGTVKKIHVSKKAAVEKGQLLIGF